MAEESDSRADSDISSHGNPERQLIEPRLLQNSISIPFDSNTSADKRIAALESAFTRCMILGNRGRDISPPRRIPTNWRDLPVNLTHSSRDSSSEPSQRRSRSRDRREPSRHYDAGSLQPRQRLLPPPPPPVLSDIVYLKEADFKAPSPPRGKWFDNDDRYGEPRSHLSTSFPNRSLYVIEVLQSDVSSVAEGRYGTRRRASSNRSLKPIPERVRIRSNHLLRALEKITKGKFTLPDFVVENTDREQTLDWNKGKEIPFSDMVFLRPFKLFVGFEKEIREYASSLKEDLETKGPENDSDVEQDRVALSHLALLIELFDTGLKGLFELRQHIADGTLQTIAFADLWHLYSMNDEICSKYQSGQVYRVLHITGGRQYLDYQEKSDYRRERSPYPRSPPPPRIIYNERRRRARSWDPESDEDDFPARARRLPGIERFQRFSTFDIQGFSLDFDGQSFGPIEKIFIIQPYEGEVTIHTLEVYPTKFLLEIGGEKDKLYEYRRNLTDRGRRFLEYSKIVHMHYYGHSLDARKEEIDSQVMVDFASAMQRNPHWRPSFEMARLESSQREVRELSKWIKPTRVPCTDRGCCGNDYIHGDNEIDLINANEQVSELEDILLGFRDPTILTDSDLMLFSPRVFGFIFRDRRWIRLHLDDLRPVEPLEAGLNALYLPSGHRESLLALVRNHSKIPKSKEKPELQFDLISGKGRGLIVLLHGPPGVGKTSTAEAIASHTQRPLFPITCGDIGENAEDVERHLSSTFQLANKWGCVLLLDEADVFLQRRNKTDLTRNSLVSVFLRILEYYSGILFLTSNRIGAIDPAFKSRIHMSLYYPSLSIQATREIWKWHINNVAKKRKDIEISKEDKRSIFQFAQTHYDELEADGAAWNGRQIRNAFQTAVALADYDAFKIREEYKVPKRPHLTKDQFEKVAKTSKEFDIYLKSTWGGLTADDIARRLQERSDQSTRKPPKNSTRGERTVQREGVPIFHPRSGKDHEDFQEDDDDEFDDSDNGGREGDDSEEDWTGENTAASSSPPQQTLLQPNQVTNGSRVARSSHR